MKMALARADGGVSIMTLMPIAVLVGEKRLALGVIRDDRIMTEEGPIELPCPVHELTPDSIPGVTLEFSDPDAEIKKWAPAQRGAVLAVHPVATAAIPADRAYRDAWTHDGKTIVHDMVKAREIHRDKLRALRAPLLAALDIDYQRADEQGDAKQKAAIAARKKALRDLPADPRIAAAKTIDDLKQVSLPQG